MGILMTCGAAALASWQHHYNWHRPHSGIGGAAPKSRLGSSRNDVLTLHNWAAMRGHGGMTAPVITTGAIRVGDVARAQPQGSRSPAWRVPASRLPRATNRLVVTHRTVPCIAIPLLDLPGASSGRAPVSRWRCTWSAHPTPRRAILGGHLGGAFIGIACLQFLGSSLPAHALAVSLSLAFMLATRTVHPPAGANPVIMVYAQAHWGALLNPVPLGVLCLVSVAVVWSRIYPGLVH